MGDDTTPAHDDLGPVVATLRQFGLLLANGLVMTALGAANLLTELDGQGHPVWLAMWATALLLGPLSMWQAWRPVGRVHRRGLVTGLVPLRRRRTHRWEDVAIAGGAGRRELRSLSGDRRLQSLTGLNVHDAEGSRLDWRTGWHLVRDTALQAGALDRTSTSGHAEGR